MSPDVDLLIDDDPLSIPGRDAESVSISQLAAEILTSGRPLQFRVRGGSMRPCIQDGDLLQVCSATERQIHTGDILLIILGGWQLVSHRVVRIDVQTVQKRYLLQGDAVLHSDGWITTDQILGIAVRVEGKRKHVNLETQSYHALARLYVAGLTVLKSVYSLWL